MAKSQPPKIPDDVNTTLARNPQAQQIFLNMAPSHQREYLAWLDEAKKAVTRERRLAQLVPKLLASAAKQ